MPRFPSSHPLWECPAAIDQGFHYPCCKLIGSGIWVTNKLRSFGRRCIYLILPFTGELKPWYSTPGQISKRKAGTGREQQAGAELWELAEILCPLAGVLSRMNTIILGSRTHTQSWESIGRAFEPAGPIIDSLLILLFQNLTLKLKIIKQ